MPVLVYVDIILYFLLQSVYEPGKRHWLKVKKDYLHEGAMADSADLIVLGAYYGTGNKGRWQKGLIRPTCIHVFNWRDGGALNFFQVGVCGQISEVKGLWTAICLWKGGLVNWKFPNLRTCELKISKFGGLRAKIWVKIEDVDAKISKFSQKGVLWTDSFAWNAGDPRKLQERREKGVFRAAHPHTPFLGQWAAGCVFCPWARVSRPRCINGYRLMVHSDFITVCRSTSADAI